MSKSEVHWLNILPEYIVLLLNGISTFDVYILLFMLKELIVLEGYLKNQFPTDSGIAGLQVEARKGDVFCEPPKVKRILSGAGSELERSACGNNNNVGNV